MTDHGKITILFVNPSSGLSGDTLSLVNLIESLKDKIVPIVLLREKAEAYTIFTSLGIECLVHQFQTVLSKPWINLKNVFIHPWRLRIVKWVRYDISCLRYVKKTLMGRKIDIVHTNTAPTVIGMRIANMMNIPHIWHIRETVDKDHTNAVIALGRKSLKRAIMNANARIVVSNTCLKEWGFDRQNTWVIMDAVRRKSDICYNTTKDPYFLFCSNWITKAKGASRVIAAFGMSGLFAPTSNIDIPIRLELIGNCEENYKKELLVLAERYGCAESIDFIPAQKDVKPFFSKAMALIQPSINEGLGRTTAEAMFFGCPVVAMASGGTLDLIRHGETGWLFNTEEECAILMKTVCTTDQGHIILRAQDFAKKYLSIEHYGKKVENVYHSILIN